MSRFEMEASGSQHHEQRLHPPPEALISQRSLRAIMGGKNQQFAIFKADRNPVEATTPDKMLTIRVIPEPRSPLAFSIPSLSLALAPSQPSWLGLGVVGCVLDRWGVVRLRAEMRSAG